MTKDESRYSCDSQQRVLILVDVMVGHEVNGMTTKELADRMNVNTTTIYRDLVNLQIAGWVEQLQDGKWRISIDAAKMLRKINDGIQTALSKVNAARAAYQGA